jgi:uncharacterized protein YegP (UPF0339 family)
MTGKFVIKEGRNGQLVATSETYTTKASCMNGIKAVKTPAADVDVEDQTTKAWEAQQATGKAATKTAAKAAEKALSKAASASRRRHPGRARRPARRTRPNTRGPRRRSGRRGAAPHSSRARPPASGRRRRLFEVCPVPPSQLRGRLVSRLKEQQEAHVGIIGGPDELVRQ